MGSPGKERRGGRFALDSKVSCFLLSLLGFISKRSKLLADHYHCLAEQGTGPLKSWAGSAAGINQNRSIEVGADPDLHHFRDPADHVHTCDFIFSPRFLWLW